MKPDTNWDQFAALDIRVGTIIKAEDFPEARKPAFKLLVDFGDEIGTLKSSAQITAHYSVDTLVNRQVIAVVNFGKKQIGPFISECLVLGVYDVNSDVVLIRPDTTMANGAQIG